MSVGRDMSEAQFRRELEKRGWKLEGWYGYVKLDNGLSVSRLNAGERRRSQLAYLIEQNRKHAESSPRVPG